MNFNNFIKNDKNQNIILVILLIIFFSIIIYEKCINTNPF